MSETINTFVFMNEKGQFLQIGEPLSVSPKPKYSYHWGKLENATVLNPNQLRNYQVMGWYAGCEIKQKIPAIETRTVTILKNSEQKNEPTTKR